MLISRKISSWQLVARRQWQGITMEVKNPERVQRLKEALSSLGKENNLCLIHDIDADGMSSGTLLKHALRKLGLSFRLELTDITRKNVLCEENQRKIKEAGIDCIIVTDIAIAGFGLLGIFNEMQNRGIRLVVFDHHEYTPSLQEGNSLLIHPVDIFGSEHSSVCATKLVYDIVGGFVPISEYDWIKAVGMIGDMNFLDYPDELKAILQKYETQKLQISSNGDYFKTRLGKISDMVNSATAIGNNEALSNMFKVYSESKGIDDLEKKLEKMDVKKINDQINYYVNNFESLSEKTRDIYFLEVKSPFFIGSPISSIISQTKTDHTFIVYQRKGDAMLINSRRQDKRYSMRDLMHLSAQGLPDSNGGGHVPAAGASVKVGDFEKFKQNLLENYAKVKVDA